MFQILVNKKFMVIRYEASRQIHVHSLKGRLEGIWMERWIESEGENSIVKCGEKKKEMSTDPERN